jgi:hypothetical protein
MPLALAAPWILGDSMRRDRTGLVGLAGRVVGLAFQCKQYSGGVAGIALGIYSLIGPPCARGPGWRHAIAFAVGVMTPLSAFVGVVILQGAAAETFHQTVRLALQAAAYTEALRRPDPWPLFGPDLAFRRHFFDYLPPVLLDLHFVPLLQSQLYRTTGVVDGLVKVMFWAPPVVVVLGLARVAWSWRAVHEAADPRGIRGLLLVTLVALAARVAFSPPHDWIHLFVLYPPTLLLLAGLLAGPARRWRVVGASLTGALGLLLAVSLVLTLQLRERFDTPLETARGTIYGTAAQVASIQPLLAWLDARGDAEQQLIVFPYIPLFNFLTGRAPLTRYYVVWPAHVEPERDDEILAALEAHPQAPVVYSPSQFPNLPAFRDYAPRVFEHLVQHYEIAHLFGGEAGGLTFLALERQEPPAGTSLLGAPLQQATVRRVGPDGGPRAVSGAERAALVGETSWPFARVLRTAVTPRETAEVRFDLMPAAGDRFAASAGVDPDRWQADPPPRARFAVVVEDGADAHVVYEREIAPRRRRADRHWAPLSVDLTPWAGRRITLVLRVTGPPAARAALPDAGWAWPRLVAGAPS